MDEDIVDKFDVLLTMIESLKSDVVKHASGNKSAGLRVRRGLRDAKKLASDIVRESVERSR